MLRSLDDVLAPLPVGEFAAAVDARKRFHVQTTDPRRAESLLPWPEIEALISMRRFENMKVMHNGMVVPPQLYNADVSALHDVLLQGASIVATRVDADVPQIQWLATAIERQLGREVGVNAYLSFSEGGAFKPHWDRHDVLVLQVHGAKTWSIWNATLDNPVEMSRFAKHDITDAPCQSLELAAGDVLFIPRGEPHAASVSGGASVHLTFGIERVNGVDALQRLQQAAGEDALLRADVPAKERPAQLQAYEAEWKARLHRMVDALDLTQFLHDSDLQRPPLRQVSLSTFAEPSDLVRLTLRRRVPLDGDTVTIGGVAHTLSAAAVDLLRRLFERDWQTRAALEQALASRHASSAVERGLRELARLGFIATHRPI